MKAGLVWDTPGEFEHQGRFDSKNLTLTEESWENLSYDLGSIAISDDEAASFGLPKAQRFPWDGTKGLYFLNGYHGIHCLVSTTCHKSPLVLSILTSPRKSSEPL
jgi:hypothetical protein